MNGATVTVVSHSKDFTVVSNSYLRDKSLSLKAKGLLTLILSLANNSDWDFSVRGIISIVKEGETSVYSAIKELKENGYCKDEKSRDDKKRVTGIHYTFFEQKQ